MDEGWTRLVLDNHRIPFQTITDADFRSKKLDYDAIILPSQSERDIVEGLRTENYPAEFSGGITEQGVENLKNFVEKGGKIICAQIKTKNRTLQRFHQFDG